MQFIQRRFSTRITFHFSDDILKYTKEDSNGSSSYKLKYEIIDLKNESEISVRNSMFRNAAIISIIFGSIQIYSQFYFLNNNFALLWFLLGLILLAIYQIDIKKYRVYTTDNCSIYILHDKNQKTIINEITSRRNNKLKEQYFEIDFRNGLENEIAKYKWLEDENVITKDECKEKITELKIKYLNSSFSVN